MHGDRAMVTQDIGQKFQDRPTQELND